MAFSILRHITCIDLREEKIQNLTQISGINVGKETFLDSTSLHYGKFLISKLSKTQGLTIANTLRRILLYEVPASGITSVNIFRAEIEKTVGTEVSPTYRAVHGFADQVHEYSRIPGLLESVLELTMNLQSIILKDTSILEANLSVLPKPTSFYGITDSTASERSLSEAHHAKCAKLWLPLAGSAMPGRESINSFPNSSILLERDTTIPGRAEPTYGSAEDTNGTSHGGADTTHDTNVAPSIKSISPSLKPLILRAKNLELPKNISIVYPEQYIATIMVPSDSPSSPSESYICECTIESFDPRIVGTTGIDDGVSFTHSKIFPVKKVNYTIESLGRKPDLFNGIGGGDKNVTSTKALFDEQNSFEVWTNGAISPQKVLEYALSYSIALFSNFFFDKSSSSALAEH
jgi:DNA-directed RNA polymerase alpha subunit